MNFHRPRLRFALTASVALLAAPACTGLPDVTPPVPADQPADDVIPTDPTHPSDVVVPSDAFLRVTGVDGGAIEPEADGSYLLEVRAGQVAGLRTVAFRADIAGADVIEWSRDDAFLKSANGQLIALESALNGHQLSIVVGTTHPVSSDDADGEVLARLHVVPTAAQASVTLNTEGRDLGFIDDAGRRLAITSVNAAFARSGS